ncbi:MAG TPA: amidase [Kofleriaceae bacterium]|nr:amidase [Kofleriaceae bacterium]
MLDPAGAPRPPGLADYAAAYRSGRRTPIDVCEATLAAIRDSDRADPPLRAVLRTTDERARREAAAATERWRRGAPLSPLDGVPVLIKDNTDVAGVPTSNGTALDFPLPRADAWVVARLSAAGAVVIGKSNLHEIGAGTTGINPHHGTARNPHDPARWCGGSSSGSASAVAAGLVPLSLATDAGGSIRAPAAFVGEVGLKPTFGRVSRLGMSILCDTLDTLGPIAHSCADAASALVAMAGVHPDDDETWDQVPLPDHAAALDQIERPITGMRIGVARHLLKHRRVLPAVAEAVAAAGEALARAGARLADVVVPEVDTCLMVGLVLLGAEGPSGMEDLLLAQRHRLGADLQVLLQCGEHVTARDYLKAQRIRQQIRAAWRALLREVDLVLMPSAGMPAGIIRADALTTGELDEEVSGRAVACTFPSNLTGYPAVSVPCGRVGGMPVGAQLVAPPWQELRALQAGAALERAGLYRWAAPPRFFGGAVLG